MSDFNGDGKLDLAVFQPGANGVPGSVSILLGSADGTFQSPKTQTLTSTAACMAVADFNLDKKADLAIGDSSNLGVYIGNGDGTFQAPQNTVLSMPCLDLLAADFNGDAKPDLAVVTGAGVQTLLDKGDGTFMQGALIQDLGVVPPVAVADLNHDGKMDLLVSTIHFACSTPPCNNPSTVDITVFLGNGDGSFQSGQVAAFLNFLLVLALLSSTIQSSETSTAMESSIWRT